MQPDTKITAHVNPTQPDTCTFEVEHAVYAAGSIQFSSAQEAQGSPLAEALFALPGITTVLIAGHTVTVTVDGPADWRELGRQVGQTIRAQLQSGQEAVAAHLQPPPMSDDTLKQQIEALFTAQVNPAIAAHGGHVELVDVKAGTLYVRLGGGCQGCASATATLRQGIETMVRQQIPQITQLLDVTDHAAGSNPYYAPPA